QYLMVSDRDRTATFGKEDPLVFELTTRQFLQFALPGQVLGGNHLGFGKIGTSNLKGIRVDLYERRRPSGTREVVWLNPSNGVPVQSAFYERGDDGREHQMAQLDVTTNVGPPADMPSIDPPAGYALIHRDRDPRAALEGGR